MFMVSDDVRSRAIVANALRKDDLIEWLKTCASKLEDTEFDEIKDVLVGAGHDIADLPDRPTTKRKRGPVSSEGAASSSVCSS